MPGPQKVPTLYFQSQFYMSKINTMFFFPFFILRYQFKRSFFVKKVFLFSEIMPNFCRFRKYNNFLGVCTVLALNLTSFEPTKIETR